MSNPLTARVAIVTAATGLCAAVVNDGYCERTFPGYLSEAMARQAGIRFAECLGRVPYIVGADGIARPAH